MNIIQFLSSVILHGIDFGANKIPVIGKIVSVPIRLFFPTLGYEKIKTDNYDWRLALSVYIAGFIVTFGILSVGAIMAGYGHHGLPDFQFGPSEIDGGPKRILFFDDIYNLLNFGIIVPLYLVAGTGFMLSLFSINDRLEQSGKNYKIQFENKTKPFFRGIPGVVFFCFLLIFAQAGYANDVQNVRTDDPLFWFHGDLAGQKLGKLGFIYLTINALLAGFVILIVLLHLELFRWSYLISGKIRTFDEKNLDLFVNDGNKLKEWLAPFSETAVWSKAFAILLAMNLYTWKASGVSSRGLEDGSSIFWWVWAILFVFIGVWLISLPRYRVQFEILKLRKKKGIHEYFDIRQPWILGWSATMDLILITFLSTAVVGSDDLATLSELF